MNPTRPVRPIPVPPLGVLLPAGLGWRFLPNVLLTALRTGRRQSTTEVRRADELDAGRAQGLPERSRGRSRRRAPEVSETSIGSDRARSRR